MSAIEDRHAENVEREGFRLYDRLGDETSKALDEGRQDDARAAYLRRVPLLAALIGGRTAEVARILDEDAREGESCR